MIINQSRLKVVQEFDSMEEKGISKLKEQHDEFIIEAGKYKSITAIYGRQYNPSTLYLPTYVMFI